MYTNARIVVCCCGIAMLAAAYAAIGWEGGKLVKEVLKRLGWRTV